MFSMIFDVISPNNASEYRFVGTYMGNFLTALRLALGDFDFDILDEEDPLKGGLNKE